MTGFLLLVTLVTAADAANLPFRMRNDHPHAVEVKLYSQNRRHVWPGGGEVYAALLNAIKRAAF